MDWYRLGQRFSIRTYHVGAVSVLLGSLLLGSPVVQAEENVSLDSQPLETVVEEVAKAEETVLVPASTEASVTPAEASLPAASTDKVETATSEKAGIETPDLAKEKAGDVEAIEEKVAEAPAIQEEAQKEPTVKEPTKVSVGNLSYLTENEKAAVRANVLAVNESATDVVVSDNGTVTVYFGEKTLVLDASKTVKQKAVVSNRRLRSATVLEHDEIIIGADNFNSKVDMYGDASFNREKSVLELTPPISSKVGYVKLKDKIDISKSFNIDAKFNILQTNPDRSIGFDGISFILAPIDENRVGIGGAGLGISGLSDVLAVKIDTYSNPSEHLPGIGDADYVEPGGDREIPHIAFVQTDGNGYMTPFNGSAKSVSINYKENIWQDFNISYDENTQLMTATVGGKVIRIYLISYLDRIKEKYGSTKVSFLFSSSNFGHDSEPDTLNELKINRIDYYRERTVPRDNEQYEPAVSAGKALIDGSDAPNSPLSDADKEVVKAKVTIQPEAPVDTVISPSNVISGTPDNPVVEVTVIYPDGTVDRVNVPVKQKDNEKYNPIVGKVTKPETDPVTAQDVMNQVTAPNGTQLTDKQVKGDLPTTVGTHNVPVEVTYPDGTKEIVNVPVEITDVADKDQFDPIVGKVTKPETDPVTPQDVTDQVTAPNGTQLTDKQVKGDLPTTVGTHNVPVEVTYPDGTKEIVNVPVEITKGADNATNEPQLKPDAPNTPAVSAGKALIDGSDTPESPLSPADQEVVKDKVDTSNLPTGTIVTPADKVTGTEDAPVVEVTVTYPDGTTDTIEVPVKQKDSASNEPTVKPDEANTPTVSAGKALIDGSDAPESPLSDADKAVVADKVDTSNLPEGTTVTPADKVSGTPENPVVEVTVTYPDGTTDTIAVPVKQKDSATNEPTVKPDEANTPAISTGKALIDGSDTPNSPLSDADKAVVADKVDTSNLPEGTTVTPADKVTGTDDNPVVEVTVTYPDGTTDTIEVPVKQKDSASNEPSVKADEPNTPAISAGKALIDGSDTPESPLSDADKAIVADKVDTSNLPEGTTVTPADKVSGTPENPVVEVTVTYPDGTTDTINVPVKQKDSATNEPTVKPDEANTPTVSAGKALIDGSDAPESPLSPADQEAVKDKVDTSNLPAGTTVTPADKVSGTPENPVVEVTVTYPDGTTDTINVPVKQKDSATNEPSVKADEPNTPAISAGKALIDGSDKPNSPLSDADKAVVADKVDTSNLPAGTTVTPADKVTGTPDNPVVEVTVTYPDGTTDTVNIPVKQKDSASNEPTVKPDETGTPEVSAGKALIDGSDTPESPLSDADKAVVADKVDTSNLPQGTVVTPADKVTGTEDAPVVEVTVTYPDGTTDTIEVPVKQKDSATNEPAVKPDEANTPAISAGKALIDGSDTPESPLSDADKAVVADKVDTSNLPAGTTVTPADKVTGTPENPVVEVTVTYPDGTTDTVNIPVKQKDSASNEPTVKPDADGTPEISAGKALIDGSDKPESPLTDADKEAVKDKVDTSNLPAGTTVTPADKVTGTPDNPVVEVTVTYPDGTTDTIEVPVKQKDSSTNEPAVKPDEPNTPAISAGKALIDGSDTPESPLSPADQEAVKDKVDTSNLPQGTVVTPADKVTGTEDAPVVEVTVTYPDGTTDTIEVPVKQKDSSTNEPSVKADEPNTPTVSTGKALIDGSDKPNSPLTDADKEAVKDKVDTSKLPDGTTVTPADKVTGTPDNPVVEVTVTYPDGTTDTVNIPVKQKDSASNEPTVKPDADGTPEISAGKVLIDGSDTPESPLSDADKAVVADKVDTSNLPEGTIVTPADKVSGTPENPVVEVTVTYPDGTTDTINVPVKQKDSA
ncbi:hypothetical protein BU200_09815, partial [Streptococcus acidominimus]